MSIKEQHISYKTQGRFFTYGNPDKATHLIVAIHGYAQLAAFFIRKFNTFDPDKYYIICPEGPNRFYQSGTAGRVGASWMTKEDRLVDIDNYITFLDTLIGDTLSENDFKQKSLLGFSQGGATASRWIAYGKCSFDNFLLWAGVFPPDMDAKFERKFFTQKNYFIVGSRDEYTTSAQAEEYYNGLNAGEMTFEMIKFDGNHSIDVSLLKTLIK